MASKINLIPIELDDGSANSPNLENSNRIVVYVPAGTTTNAGIVQLVDDLTTDDSTKALTAKQGKKLNDEKQHNLTKTAVSDGTIDLAIGFDSSGNLIKGVVATGGNIDNKIAEHNESNSAHSDLFAAKQDVLTFDNAPTEDSSNPVKSGGVYTALGTKADADDVVNTVNGRNGTVTGLVEAEMNGMYDSSDHTGIYAFSGKGYVSNNGADVENKVSGKANNDNNHTVENSVDVSYDKVTIKSKDDNNGTVILTTLEVAPSGAKVNGAKIPEALDIYSTSQEDTYSASYINSQLSNISATASGKTNSYTISYANANNIDFNSSTDTITLSVSASITDTLGNTISLADLKVGDVVYVTETNVPDRWVGSKDSSNIVFYKMETTKVDISGKVDKTTGTYKLYGTDSQGNQTTLPYDTYPAGSFVRRDGNSQITIPQTPTADGHATSKKYVDTEIGKKQTTLKAGSNITLADGTGDDAGKVIISSVDTKADGMIADAYSDAATYALDDLVIYNNTLYKCTTAVTTAESFDSNKWTSTTIETLLGTKQDTLTFDNTPTQNSQNPVTSGGIYTALGYKQDTIQYSTMPTASADNVGQIVQFTGTTGTYKNGFFYKCVLDNGSYDWEEIVFGSTLTPLSNAQIDTIMDAILV